MHQYVCEVYMSAIINGDFSSLDDYPEERERLERAIDGGVYYEISNGSAICADDFAWGEPSYLPDDLTGLMANCYEFISGKEDIEHFLEFDAPQLVFDRFLHEFSHVITEKELQDKAEKLYWRGFWIPQLLKDSVELLNDYYSCAYGGN